jgi:DNA-binding NarL/FixJ family response regulator
MAVSVLIVDDDSGFRRAAAELLADRGYRVAGEATSGNDALVCTQLLEPDAILLDVNLPDGSGVGVARKLSSHPNRPRVVLISTDPDAVSNGEVQACGACGFLAKTCFAAADLDDLLKS